MPAVIHPFPSPMPSSRGGICIWAKASMVETARIWANAIRLKPNASIEDIQAAHDECADIRDAFLQCVRMFTEALDGEYSAAEGYISDAIGDGLEHPLQRELDDLGRDAEDLNAEHRLDRFTQLGR
jgi:hypothetical protein